MPKPALSGQRSSVLGQHEEARAEYTRVIELNPSAPNSHAAMGLTYLSEGKFEEAATAAQKDAADWARLAHAEPGSLEPKTNSRSRRCARRSDRKSGEAAAFQIAEVYAYRDEKDHAFEWLERARRQRDAGLAALRADPLLTNLHDDPRWDAVLRTVGLADDQLK